MSQPFVKSGQCRATIRAHALQGACSVTKRTDTRANDTCSLQTCSNSQSYFSKLSAGGSNNGTFWGVLVRTQERAVAPRKGAGQLLQKMKRCGKVLLLRPDIRADVVARGSICNIEKAITDLECRAVVGEHLVKDWMRKFQFGYGKWLRAWDEEVKQYFR